MNGADEVRFDIVNTYSGLSKIKHLEGSQCSFEGAIGPDHHASPKKNVTGEDTGQGHSTSFTKVDKVCGRTALMKKTSSL